MNKQQKGNSDVHAFSIKYYNKVCYLTKLKLTSLLLAFQTLLQYTFAGIQVIIIITYVFASNVNLVTISGKYFAPDDLNLLAYGNISKGTEYEIYIFPVGKMSIYNGYLGFSLKLFKLMTVYIILFIEKFQQIFQLYSRYQEDRHHHLSIVYLKQSGF